MCQINRGRSCLDGSQPWTHALALPGGMFVLLLENLEWFGWEKTEGRLIVVVWFLFKGIQVLVGPRQFSRRQQSVGVKLHVRDYVVGKTLVWIFHQNF